ncbi:hypothetical protein D3C83_208300 [compost metagenome]
MNKNCSIYEHKQYPHEYTKKDIDKVDHEFLYIRSYFGKHRESFAAALIFELMIGELHGML